MKKLSLILIFTMLLIIKMSISIFAANGENVAIYGEASVNYTRWSIDPKKIIDGNRSEGCASNQSYKDMDYYIELDREYTISELIVVVNGIGTYPTDPAFTWNTPSNNEFWFEVRAYDAQGNETYKKGANHSTRDQNENYEVIFDLNEVKVKKITVYVVQSYNNCVGLWEVEAYEHNCQFDTLIQTLKPETCITPGEGVFKCECGKTEKHEIIPNGNHQYTDFESFEYENGFLSKGIKTFGCPTCDDYIEEETQPLFKFLGYSISRNGKSVCVSYVVNREYIADYNLANNVILDYGIVCAVSDSQTPLTPNGSVAENINGQSRSLIDTEYPRFDIKISSNDWTKTGDTPLIMCAYVIDGDKITYVCSETNTETATSICYNQLHVQPI